MRLASLGSGSKGNATLVQDEAGCLLIDCGFSLKQFEQRLQRLSVAPEDIRAILVTHEHSDHGAGVSRLARRHGIPVWTSIGTARALKLEQFEPICGGEDFELAGLDIQAVTVPHDAAEPLQFVFSSNRSGKRLGILTDCGHITPHMVDIYSELDGLLLEFNYDAKMLAHGPYPPYLKDRIAGRLGHLANDQSMAMLEQVDSDRLKCLIAAHISEKNNSPERVSDLLHSWPASRSPLLACQQQGFHWVDI